MQTVFLFSLVEMASCTVVTSNSAAPSLVKLKIPFRRDKGNDCNSSRIILVIDRSGSMSGGKTTCYLTKRGADREHLGPWKQVQSAVKSIEEMNRMLDRDASAEPIVITYNDTVSVTNLASIARTNAAGSTDFAKGNHRPLPQVRVRTADSFVAFQQVQNTVKDIDVKHRIVIIFMTDGCDSCNRPNQLIDAQTRLRMFLRNKAPNCVVHVIGYSEGHDLNMMNALKGLGSTEGIYRYAEGSKGLDEKFRELFEFADFTTEFTLKVPHIKDVIKVTGELVDAEHIEAECWLSMTEAMAEPLEITIGNDRYRVVPIFTQPDTMFILKSLSKRAIDITTQAELDQIQGELQAVKMFGAGVGGKKAEREQVIELRAELQTRLDALHAIMADIARGTLNQTAALAKLNDLRYADK